MRYGAWRLVRLRLLLLCSMSISSSSSSLSSSKLALIAGCWSISIMSAKSKTDSSFQGSSFWELLLVDLPTVFTWENSPSSLAASRSRAKKLQLPWLASLFVFFSKSSWFLSRPDFQDLTCPGLTCSSGRWPTDLRLRSEDWDSVVGRRPPPFRFLKKLKHWHFGNYYAIFHLRDNSTTYHSH